MPEPTTEDYIKAITDAKANGHAVGLDFSNMPDGVDQATVVKALSNGLPDEYHQALMDASDGGHSINLDFSTIKPQDSMANHPILDTVEKTAELGGMAAGGIAGAGAGALTSPVTGPVGPLAGSVAGAGLGYGAVKSGANALNQVLGYTPAQTLGDASKEAVSAVGEGAKTQLEGEGAGAALGAGLKGAKAAFPYVAKFLKTMPKPVAERLMADPELPTKFSGTPGAIEDAVGKMQDGLKVLKEKASQIYEEALSGLGLGNPKTAEQAAEKLANFKAMKVIPPKDIGTAYLDLVTNPSISDVDKLAEAVRLNKSINATTKWAASGQQVAPVASDLAPTLQKVKDGVMNLLKSIPGGDKIIEADHAWHLMRQVYDTLQPQLADTGKATTWLTKVISDEGTASATAKAALATLDKATGSPVSSDAMNHVAVGLMKRPMAESMIGKMGMMAAILHPGGRLLTLPVAVGMQSPMLQTLAVRGGAAVNEALAGANSHMLGPMIQGLHQGVQNLPDPSRSGLPSQKDD